MNAAETATSDMRGTSVNAVRNPSTHVDEGVHHDKPSLSTETGPSQDHE